MSAQVDVAAARPPRLPGWLWAAALVVAAPLIGAALGETPIPLDTVWRSLANQIWGAGYPVDPIDQGIVWSYRLPRALVAGACGAGLAIAGLVLQTLLRNALADPYLLGISAGASTGAVLVAVAGLGAAVLPMSAGALLGALAAFALVAGLSRLAGGGPTARGAAQIVLAGIAGSQLFNALTSFIIARSASAEQARGIMFWLLGNLSGVRWDDVGLAVAAAATALGAAMWHVRSLDAFTFGTESAASLGVPVRRVQGVLILATAAATAVLVSITGAIGFVGLVVPHAARLLVGSGHARLVPASALIGMVFLIAADVIARMLVPGQTLPIGVVTALVGAPAFAIILIRARRMP
ncbi:FecCD family ABC transporter permease [Paracoccus tibetensis]|uniref:Iron complex transport system permease protein n=1 Tax=Paracoccus tibetensis TaxID=336292 RepID=A0A1G5FUL1_9RHOB|nr:iron ABC transporter permease [Paracoccus tibetensis]SCY42844.1 iron complex transport system permease protein [Paracoccus tibetensis]